ncbi:11800_t:CDS:1, partial [Entrophospora sp. SA101]
LKISDAITLCSDAWKAVTAETIKNCWLKTGILPISEDSMEVDTGSNNQQVGDLQNLIDELNTIETSDKLDATEFITIDNDDSLEYGGTEVTDEEIISCVRPTTLETEQEEEEGIPQTITTVEVLKSLDTVISYVKNPPQNLVFKL